MLFLPKVLDFPFQHPLSHDKYYLKSQTVLIEYIIRKMPYLFHAE
ncbi:hypothetical protein BN133_3813 [Cronobacter dublinensis 582]|nr:hypothetical protein BN133_3813 [Cronobacter dublinensis 582]